MDIRDSKIERIVTDENQWYDPTLLLVGNGNVEWARWATKWLYRNVTGVGDKSSDWPKYGVITQFDRSLVFALTALATPVNAFFQTNNRNWLLLTRAATVIDGQGNNLNLSLFNLSLSVPPLAFLIENQPVSLTHGSGEWPHVMYFPEEWTENVARTFSVSNNSGVAATLTLNALFLQVRQN